MKLSKFTASFFAKVNSNDEFVMNTSSIAPIDDAVSVSTLSSTNDDHRSQLIVQYHYTQWKDMDVPNDSHSLLHMIHEVNEQTPPEQYPIVVHCT
jgi:protein tyrosine phosphatase